MVVRLAARDDTILRPIEHSEVNHRLVAGGHQGTVCSPIESKSINPTPQAEKEKMNINLSDEMILVVDAILRSRTEKQLADHRAGDVDGIEAAQLFAAMAAGVMTKRSKRK
jgi:hypothetical protein